MGLIQKTKRWNVFYDEPNDDSVQLSLLPKGPTLMQNTNNKVVYNELLAKKTKEIVTVYVPRISKYLENTEYMDWKCVYILGQIQLQ